MAAATASPHLETASPPPTCAICLGPFSNKCFSDSCRHQFCFNCLLEWSKVKAECPLCKQAFRSIKHNVKSNNEYEEYIIAQQDNGSQESLDILFGELEDPYWYLPYRPPPPQRQFQFQTTLTVDPHGEWAIQQMLLSHTPPQYLLNPSRYFRSRRRGGVRAASVTNFRRAIYQLDWWVSPTSANVVGRYRECTPEFYRQHANQRNRLVPWLNRELNALLQENTQRVMYVVDVIMQNLLYHHILSSSFKRILVQHFQGRTDHFIHEFYSFMRSTYDMIGYDNNICYEHHRHIPPIAPIEVVSDDDSDVSVSVLTTEGTVPLPCTDVIEINTTDSDNSDVIIQEPPPPPIVDLVDTDSDTTAVAVETVQPLRSSSEDNKPRSSSEENKKPIVLPLKVRLKYSKKKRRPARSASSDSSCSDYSNYKNGMKHKRMKKLSKTNSNKWYNYSKSSSSSSSSSDDDKPLSSVKSELRESKEYEHRSKRKSKKKVKKHKVKSHDPPSSSNKYHHELRKHHQDETHPANEPGPSGGRLRSVIIKRENSNLWFARPYNSNCSDSEAD